jgi:hypothetical protein
MDGCATPLPSARQLSVLAAVLLLLALALSALQAGNEDLPAAAALALALRGGGAASAAAAAAAAAQPRWATSVARFRHPSLHCTSNYYLADWDGARFRAAAGGLVAFRASQNAAALERAWHAPGWGRFDASPPLTACAGLARYPSDDLTLDGAKWLCGLRSLAPGCVIYSLGSNAQFDFEYLMVEHTPCEVHTFDCTVDARAPSFPREELAARGRGRVVFHPLCVSDGSSSSGGSGSGSGAYRTLRQLTRALNHTTVNLLKMDIEGYEYRVLEGLLADTMGEGGGSEGGSAGGGGLDYLPLQISFELHTRSNALQAAGLNDPPRAAPPPEGWYNTGGLSAGDMQVFWSQLTDLGYVVAAREDNAGFQGGAEFTVVRAFC